MRTTLKLDAATFERLTSKRNFQPQTLEIARRLIVDGEEARELAHAYGLSVGRMYNITNQVTAAYHEERLPKGCVEVTLIVPKNFLPKLNRIIAAERKELDKCAEIEGAPSKSGRKSPAKGRSKT